MTYAKCRLGMNDAVAILPVQRRGLFYERSKTSTPKHPSTSKENNHHHGTTH